MRKIRLGLIGDHIGHSRSPLLHRRAGELCGLAVSYDRLVPAEQGQDFDALFDRCRDDGYRGINVTYPYKERAFARAEVDDPAVRRLGACNTILFEASPKGHNTDHTGFAGAWRATFGNRAPGRAAMAGAGGVGKAVAFALADLGAESIRICDSDRDRARRLAAAVDAVVPSVEACAADTIEEAADKADGLVNSTPLGMDGHPGTAIDERLMAGRAWAFDAVYTPVDTQFLRAARAAGLETMSGYELFFHQGLDAFRLFTGEAPNTNALRDALHRDMLGPRPA